MSGKSIPEWATTNVEGWDDWDDGTQMASYIDDREYAWDENLPLDLTADEYINNSGIKYGRRGKSKEEIIKNGIQDLFEKAPMKILEKENTGTATKRFNELYRSEVKNLNDVDERMERLYRNYRYGVWYMNQLDESKRKEMNSSGNYRFLDADLYRNKEFDKAIDKTLEEFRESLGRLFGDLNFYVTEDFTLNMNTIVNNLISVKSNKIDLREYLRILYPKLRNLINNPTAVIKLPENGGAVNPQAAAWTNTRKSWEKFVEAEKKRRQLNQPEQQPVLKDEGKEKQEKLEKSKEEARKIETTQINNGPLDTNFFHVTSVPDFALPEGLSWQEAWKNGYAVENLKRILKKDQGWDTLIDTTVKQLNKDILNWRGTPDYEIVIKQLYDYMRFEVWKKAKLGDNYIGSDSIENVSIDSGRNLNDIYQKFLSQYEGLPFGSTTVKKFWDEALAEYKNKEKDMSKIYTKEYIKSNELVEPVNQGMTIDTPLVYTGTFLSEMNKIFESFRKNPITFRLEKPEWFGKKIGPTTEEIEESIQNAWKEEKIGMSGDSYRKETMIPYMVVPEFLDEGELDQYITTHLKDLVNASLKANVNKLKVKLNAFDIDTTWKKIKKLNFVDLLNDDEEDENAKKRDQYDLLYGIYRFLIWRSLKAKSDWKEIDASKMVDIIKNPSKDELSSIFRDLPINGDDDVVTTMDELWSVMAGKKDVSNADIVDLRIALVEVINSLGASVGAIITELIKNSREKRKQELKIQEITKKDNTVTNPPIADKKDTTKNDPPNVSGNGGPTADTSIPPTQPSLPIVQTIEQADLDRLRQEIAAKNAIISEITQKNIEKQNMIEYYEKWKLSFIEWTTNDKYEYLTGQRKVGTELNRDLLAVVVKNTTMKILNEMGQMEVYTYDESTNRIFNSKTFLGGIDNKDNHIVISRKDLKKLEIKTGSTMPFSATPLLMGNRIEKDLFERLGQQQSGTGEVNITFSDSQGTYLSLTMIRAQLKRRELSGDYWIIDFDRSDVIRYDFQASQRRDLIEKEGTVEVKISDSGQPAQTERMYYDSVPSSTGRSGTQARIGNEKLQLYVTDFSSTKFKLDMMVIKS